MSCLLFGTALQLLSLHTGPIIIHSRVTLRLKILEKLWRIWPGFNGNNHSSKWDFSGRLQTMWWLESVQEFTRQREKERWYAYNIHNLSTPLIYDCDLFWWIFKSSEFWPVCFTIERKQVACKSLSSSFRVQLGMTTISRFSSYNLYNLLYNFSGVSFSRIGNCFGWAVVLTNEALELWLRWAEVARGARMTAQWRRWFPARLNLGNFDEKQKDTSKFGRAQRL